jgi:MYND finger/Ankyrin repeats (many copies)
MHRISVRPRQTCTALGARTLLYTLHSASTMSDEATEHRCANCRDASASKCSKCKIAFYCSVECQRTNFRRHKLICIQHKGTFYPTTEESIGHDTEHPAAATPLSRPDTLEWMRVIERFAFGKPSDRDMRKTELLLRKFLSLGGDINCRDDLGWSLLHTAVNKDFDTRDMVAMLIGSCGADVNVRTTINRLNGKSATSTPLHLACQFGKSYDVEMLINAGADVNARNRYGRTPLLLCYFCPPAIRLLHAAGANMHAFWNGSARAEYLVGELRINLSKGKEV